MSNTSNKKGVLSCGKGWMAGWEVFSGWGARGSGETGAAGAPKVVRLSSWFLSGGEGP